MFTTPDRPAELGCLSEELSPRFVVQRSLSVSRYKRVILARDTLIDREVAVSVVEVPLGIEMRDTALNEIRAAALLGQKPNIATIYDVIETPQCLLVVCEFFPGGTLEELLDRYDMRRLPLDKALRVATQVCNALGYVHDEGIVHRDLKTSNLMFDDAGVVHLSDFGTSGVAHEFSLNEDRCSFGSPAYMSPEQIRGAPADIRTDLYALGCLIFEMLTGSVPFSGTREQTIAGHLATTPVSLLSLRPEVPRSIADLVHKLLEKDAAARPRDVDEVRTVLARVLARIADHQATHSGSVRFVGRDEEITAIRNALSRAEHGQPHAVFIEGPPGIGKSRLLNVATETARSASMLTLVGRCSIDDDDPLACLRAALSPIWVPPRVDGLSGDSQSARVHGAEDREQWISGLIDGLVDHAAEHGPTVLAIDNLHWANPLTLTVVTQLLKRLGSNLEENRPRLAVLLAARSIDENTVPLLDEIKDRASVLQLKGLTEADLRTWVEDYANARPTRPLLTLLARVTAGNPLFLGEVYRILEAHGDITADGHRVDLRDRSLEINLPTSALDAFRRTFEQLSSNSRRMVVMASFLGERFDAGTLARVVSLSVSGVKELLIEALARGLLRTEGNDYVFRHALARQAAYGIAGPHRREILHAQIGQRLERMTDAGLDLSIVARHYIRAGTRVDAIRTMQFAEGAGDESWAAYAFEGAAHHYEAAATAAERSPDVSLEDRAQLHFKAGFAFARGYDLRVSTHHYRIAAQLFQEAGNQTDRLRALSDIVKNEFSSGEIAPGQLAHVDELEAELDLLDQGALRAEVLETLASAYVQAGKYTKAATLSDQAMEIATLLSDDLLLTRLYGSVAQRHFEQFRLVEALDAWRTAEDHGRRAGSNAYVARGLQRQPLPLLLLGHVNEAKEVIQRANAATKATNNVGESSLVLTWEVITRTLAGEFESALGVGMKALEIIESTRYPWATPILIPALASSRAAAGDAEGAYSILRHLETETIFYEPSPYRSTTSRLRKLVEAMHAPSDQLRVALDGTRIRCSTGHVTPQGASRVGAYVELASWLELPELASECYAYLLAAQDQGLVLTSGWVFLVPRLIGVAATLRGERRTASLALSHALDCAKRIHAWPEYARALFDRARLEQLGENNREAWLRDLLKAEEMFLRFGMTFDLARAERFKSERQ